MEVVIGSTRDPSAGSARILGHFRFIFAITFEIAKECLPVVVKVVVEVGASWMMDAFFGAFPRITLGHERRKVVAFAGEEITTAVPIVSTVVRATISFLMTW